MNISEYISSGVLEAYVLGQLSEQEQSVVEDHVRRYPELKAELTRVEEAQERLLMNLSVVPPLHVRDGILSKISQGPVVAPDNRVYLSSASFWKYATAACVAVAVLSSYLAYDYYYRWQRSEGDLAELAARNDRMAEDYNTVTRKLDNVLGELDVIRNPSFARVLMKGTDNVTKDAASVYWNKVTQEVYISVHQLKKLTHDEQFQLWAIVDGKPVDAGVFNNETGLIRMKNISDASAFAVTIEPRGGSNAPTLSTMQITGNT